MTLDSEKVVIQSPLSFVGSARRIWRITDQNNPVLKALLGVIAVVLIAVAWCAVAVWTLLFGILLVPWRLLRRGQRKRKQETLRHRELLERSATR